MRERISERTQAAMALPGVRARQRLNQAVAMARPDVREKISRRTREAMNDPAVRARNLEQLARARPHPGRTAAISDGLKRGYAVDNELKALHAAWDDARPEVRQRFLQGLGVGQIFAWDASRTNAIPQ